MAIGQHLWYEMDIDQIPLIFVEIHRNRWNFMDLHGHRCRSYTFPVLLSGLDPSNALAAQVQVCLSGVGASMCRGGFLAVACRKFTRSHGRLCTLTSSL